MVKALGIVHIDDYYHVYGFFFFWVGAMEFTVLYRNRFEDADI